MEDTMEHIRLVPLDLQRFSEKPADQTPPAGDTGKPEGKPDTKPAADSEPTFTQAQMDAIFNKRYAKLQREADQRVEAAKTEAEKLAAMNADEKARHESEKRDAELKKREAEVTRRELRTQAVETLVSKGLPKTLADILPYADADTTNEAIVSIEKVFRQAVEAGVTERMKGEPPQANTPPRGTGKTVEEEIQDKLYNRKG